jgi:hypothetical protein
MDAREAFRNGARFLPRRPLLPVSPHQPASRLNFMPRAETFGIG